MPYLVFFLLVFSYSFSYPYGSLFSFGQKSSSELNIKLDKMKAALKSSSIQEGRPLGSKDEGADHDIPVELVRIHLLSVLHK